MPFERLHGATIIQAGSELPFLRYGNLSAENCIFFLSLSRSATSDHARCVPCGISRWN